MQKNTKLELLKELRKYPKNSRSAKNILSYIDQEVINGNLDFSASKEKEYLYDYLYACNTYDMHLSLNVLLMNKQFIETLDKTELIGSMIISLTSNCIKPRKVLLENSKKVKKSILEGDELFSSEELLNDLTREEIIILRKDHQIDNYLLTKGLRFDALKEETVNNLLAEPETFKLYDIKSIRDFANSYSKVQTLASNETFLKIYLSKIDDNYKEENIIFNYLNKKQVFNIMNSKPKEELCLSLVKDTLKDAQENLLKDKTVRKYLNKCNSLNVFNKIPRKYLIEILSEKDNLFSGINFILLSGLNKSELAIVATRSKNYYQDLLNKLKSNSSIDFKPFLAVLTDEETNDIIYNHLDSMSFETLVNLINASRVFKKEIITRSDVATFFVNNIQNIEEDLENLDTDERITLLCNCNSFNNSKILNEIIKTIPENYRGELYEDPEIRRVLFNEKSYKLDSYTTKYLLNNIEELKDMSYETIVQLLINSDVNFAEQALSIDEVLVKVFKNNKINTSLLTTLIENKPRLLKYYNKPLIAKYYNTELITSLFTVLDNESKAILATEDIINSVLKNDQESINVYKKLLNLNSNLIYTIDFRIFESSIKDLKLAILNDITKYPSLEDDVIYINKKSNIALELVTSFYLNTEELDFVKVFQNIIHLFRETCEGNNRKQYGNLPKILSIVSPKELSKSNFQKVLNNILYLIPRYNNIERTQIIEAPRTYNDIIDYEKATNQKLTELIKADKNIKENFLFKHYKLNLQEAKTLVSRYSMNRIDDSIYKEEYEFISNLNKIINTSEKDLKDMDPIYPIFNMVDSFTKESAIVKMYGKIYNFEIRGKTYANKPFVRNIYSRELKIYECPNDFLFLISNVDITKEYNKTNSFLLGWHNTLSAMPSSIPTSLISNDNLHLDSDLVFGFNGLLDEGLSEISPYNIKKVTKENSVIFMTPRELIDNTRDKNNTIFINKYAVRPNFNNSNLPTIEPDYILVDSNRLNDNTYLEKISRASQEFKTKRNKDGLPIIAIDKNKIAKNEASKIESLINKYSKSHDMNLVPSIMTKIENNYTSFIGTEFECLFYPNKLMKEIEKRLQTSNSRAELEYLINIFEEEKNKYKNLNDNIVFNVNLKKLNDKIVDRLNKIQ